MRALTLSAPPRHIARLAYIAPVTALSFAGALSLAGCADALPPATSPAASPAAASGNEAMITFVRPVSTCDTGEYAIVVDDKGHFIANVPSNSQVAFPARAGEHIFYAWSNDDIQMEINRNLNPIAAVALTAVPGHSHYVAVEVVTPCAVRSSFQMRPVEGNSGGWADLEGWLTKAQPLTVDRPAGQALLDAEPVHLRRHLDLGREKLIRDEQSFVAAQEHDALIRETNARN